MCSILPSRPIFTSLALAALLISSLPAQQVASPEAQKSSEQKAATPTDPVLEAAAEMVDHVVFLRCFCAADEVSFDAQGMPIGSPKQTDWTLTGVKLDHVARRSASQVELEGTRVVMSFDGTRDEFAQHLQKTEQVRLLLADPGTRQGMVAELDAVASFGIDPRLQRAMPPWWKHYFLPQTPWPADDLGEHPGQVPANAPPVTPPVVTHRQSASFTAEAQRNKYTGSVQLHFIVDTAGVPRRIYVQRPLGYGLDERAVEATEKMRFTPAMQSSKPIAAPVSLTQDFLLVPPPGSSPNP